MKKLFTLLALSIIGLVFNTQDSDDGHDQGWTAGATTAHADAPPPPPPPPPSCEGCGSSDSCDG